MNSQQVVLIIALLILLLLVVLYYSNSTNQHNNNERRHLSHERRIPVFYPSAGGDGEYDVFYNTVLNDRYAGCFGAATQPTGSISEGTLPLFYNHSINSMSEVSPAAYNQQWYGPHSGYLN